MTSILTSLTASDTADCAAADAIPAKPSRFAIPSEGDAVLLKAKTAGVHPGLGAQAEVLAMRV